MRDESKLILVDTNILIYAYDTQDLRKHKIAVKLLEKCWDGSTIYYISAQNLAEFFVVATKKIEKSLAIEQAEQIINDISLFEGWIKINYDAKTLIKSVFLYKKYGRSFWDSVIASTMLENQVYVIYTENTKDFENFEQITVINPFK